MESQLLDHPVVVGLLNVCVPRFPFLIICLEGHSDGVETVENPPVEVAPDFAH
jgi:hypothetical protein